MNIEKIFKLFKHFIGGETIDIEGLVVTPVKVEPNVRRNSRTNMYFKVQNPKGIILYFHGNKDNLVRWGIISSQLTKYDYDVIVIDYRGYGKSTGILSEDNFFNDALFCYTQIKETLNPKKKH